MEQREKRRSMSMYDLITALNLWSKRIKESINTCLPARVVKVNDDGSVNVVAIRNDDIVDCVITVPVIRPETQRAYIQLKINVGDRGIVKFCDKSIEVYRQNGSENKTNDDRVHSLSDGVFQLGFLPESEKFIYPDGEIVIGLKNGYCVLSIDENGNLTLKSKQIKIEADSTEVKSPISITGNVSITGTLTASTDVIANTISLTGHKHGGVATGTGKTGVPE